MCSPAGTGLPGRCNRSRSPRTPSCCCRSRARRQRSATRPASASGAPVRGVRGTAGGAERFAVTRLAQQGSLARILGAASGAQLRRGRGPRVGGCGQARSARAIGTGVAGGAAAPAAPQRIRRLARAWRPAAGPPARGRRNPATPTPLTPVRPLPSAAMSTRAAGSASNGPRAAGLRRLIGEGVAPRDLLPALDSCPRRASRSLQLSVLGPWPLRDAAIRSGCHRGLVLVPPVAGL